jgi:1,5-anhydro-D-fructose reductase (1,5-anhydro-D-mannitol-forming)
LTASCASELVAVHARRRDKAEAFARRHGAKRFYDRVESLVEDEEVDGVYIASPNNLHAEHTILAARHGKHVLCEKPMAMTPAECERMIAACQENGVKLMIAFMMRFHACHQAARRLVADGFLGQFVLADSTCPFYLPDITRTWRFDPAISAGGVVMDVAVHLIDILHYILDKEIIGVQASLDHAPDSYPCDGTSSLLLDFKGGGQGVVTVSFNAPFGESALQVHGTGGSLFVTGSFGQEPTGTFVTASASGRAERPFQPVNQYVSQAEYFISCVENDRRPVPGGLDGKKNLEIALAVYESFATGRKINIAQS